MKFIEVITTGYDDEMGDEMERVAIISIENIIALEKRRRRVINRQELATPTHSPSTSRRTQQPRQDMQMVELPIVITRGENYWVYNYSYEDLKRILMTNGNVRMTGGTV